MAQHCHGGRPSVRCCVQPHSSGGRAQVHKPLAPLPCGAPDPVADFLRAEVRRAAVLQALVQASLQHALATLNGRAALTRDLRATLRSLSVGQVRTRHVHPDNTQVPIP